MKGGFLADMAAASRRRATAARSRLAYEALCERALATPAAPPLRLHARFDVIAEIKLRSPAAGGPGRSGGNLAGRAADYAGGGAAAVSVLTEPSRFDGSLAHLADVARRLAAAGRPAMRKDFIVDPYQLVEAREAGAGGALLILRLLERAELEALVATGRRLGLFLLLEAFDAADLAVARALVAALGPEGLLVGVNARDLATLAVHPQRFAQLAPELPDGVPGVAESGLATAADVAAAAAAGYRLALVGNALMDSPEPAQLLRTMIDAGRAA